MATTRIIPLHTGKGCSFGSAISRIIGYVSNPEKTENGKLITSYGCESRCADAEFLLAKRRYIQKTGRVRGKDDVIAYHLRQAFRPGEITPEEANRIGVEFARRFTKGNHAFIVCTHTDKAHIHNHIIWSAVNLDCDRKFRNFWGSTRAVRKLSDSLCIENGLSIVEAPAPHGKSYNKWLGNRAKPSQREQLRALIDGALAQYPDSFDALLQLLKDSGCEVGLRGRSVTLRYPGWKRPARLDSLGEGYTKAELLTVLSGKSTHTPRSRRGCSPAPEKLGLLIDIQKRLQEGKGGGYARWAKVFNLKQMARTMNCLQEHGVTSWEELTQKATDAAAEYHRIAGQIKQAEAKMQEISALRTQIINYARTREVYIAYRRAGYSKKFLSEHESEILLHKAAQTAFRQLGYGRDKKLPSVKALQAEYAQLLDEKKRAYGEYRKARREMKELQTAQENVKRILGTEARESECRDQEL